MAVADSIADYIRASLDGRSLDALISAHTLDKIRPIASTLPGALTEFFGFECPLGTDEPIADFLICAGAVEGGRDVLAGVNSYAPLAAAFEQHWSWQRVRSFAKEWSDPQSPLHESVNGMWLEFDIESSSSPVPIPSVFFGSDRLRRGANTAWLTERALPLLHGIDRQRTIMRCIDALPSPAYIFQVGCMLSRADAPIRICVRGISIDETLEYLPAIGWRGSVVDLGVQLEMMAEQAQRIDLDLDVDEGIASKIGLECYPQQIPTGASQLLNWLADTGYVSNSKVSALKSWPGIAHERLRTSIWPPGLLSASAFLCGRAHSAFVRWLHHVKVVYEPGRPSRAKAYLGVRHVWIEPGAIQAAVKELDKAAIISETKSLSSNEDQVPCKS